MCAVCVCIGGGGCGGMALQCQAAEERRVRCVWGWDGMGWECVQHLPDTSPGRPYVSTACATVCPALDSEPRKPPLTQSKTGG